MAIKQWGYFVFDEGVKKTLIYLADGSLWGEAVYDEETERTEIYQYV
jgi:hypothetical protein